MGKRNNVNGQNIDDECGCGKPLKISDPRRQKAGVKKIIKKKII